MRSGHRWRGPGEDDFPRGLGQGQFPRQPRRAAKDTTPRGEQEVDLPLYTRGPPSPSGRWGRRDAKAAPPRPKPPPLRAWFEEWRRSGFLGGPGQEG